MDDPTVNRSRILRALGLIVPLTFAAPGWGAVQADPDANPRHAKSHAHADAAHPGHAGKPAEFQGKGGRPSAAEPKAHAPAAPVVPKPPKEVKESAEPSLPVPRFASLKTDETNMRRGPGQRYPIDWVYHRRDLPVEVEREYDVWRLVRDFDGVRGWVHEVTLSEQRRTFVVKDADATMRDSPDDKAAPVAVLKTGVIGRFRSCDMGAKWCQVQASGYKGYLRRDQVWGLLDDDVVAP